MTYLQCLLIVLYICDQNIPTYIMNTKNYLFLPLLFALFGFLPLVAQTDAAISAINSPESANLCVTQVIPEFVLSNEGEGDFNIVNYEYSIGGMSSVGVWFGSLQSGESEVIVLDPVSLPNGSHTFTVSILQVNGQPDSNPDNDSQSVSFSINDGLTISLELLTDDFPQETSFEIADEFGNIIAFEENFNEQNELYDFSYCVSPGCYTFTIFDTFGDGICCSEGPGSYEILGPDGTSLAQGGQFENIDEAQFCVEPLVLEDLDAAISFVSNPEHQSDFCGSSIEPRFVFRNDGLMPITEATFEYTIDGNVQGTFDWTGALVTLDAVEISLPSIEVVPGNSYNLAISIVSVNGTMDDDANNNIGSADFTVIDGTGFTVFIETQGGGGGPGGGAPLFWELFDSQGNLVNEADAELAPNSDYAFSYCLPNDCFTLNIFDFAGQGRADFTVESSNGTLLAVSEDFDDFYTTEFCSDFEPTALDANLEALLFPTPDFILCESNFTPVVSLQNLGSEDLTEVVLAINVADNTEEFTWTGNLSLFESTEINLGNIELADFGEYEVSIEVVSVNGAADGVADNNVVSGNIVYVEGQEVTVNITVPPTSEVSYVITDENGEVLIESETLTGDFGGGPGGPGIPEEEEYEFTHCLPAACFIFGLNESQFIDLGFSTDFSVVLSSGIVVVETQEFEETFSQPFCTEGADLPPYDISTTFFNSPMADQVLCGNTLEPIINIFNTGSESIEELVLTYGIVGGESFEYTWTGELASSQSTTIALPSIEDLPFGSAELAILSVVSINGEEDANQENNSTSVEFEVVDGQGITVDLAEFAIGVAFLLEDENGNVQVLEDDIFQFEPSSYDYCLGNGCYTLSVISADGGGPGGGAPVMGQLSFSNGIFIDDIDVNPGDSQDISFCVGGAELPLYDVYAVEFTYPVEDQMVCDNNLVPQINIVNTGSETIEELILEYSVNGGSSESLTWTGSLASLDATIIELPNLTFGYGDVELEIVSIVSINGEEDANPDNNGASVDFELVNGQPIVVEFTNAAQGITIELVDENGSVETLEEFLLSFEPIDLDYCIGAGCYTLVLTRGGGGGPGGGGPAQGNVVLADGSSFDFTLPPNQSEAIDFCIESGNSAPLPQFSVDAAEGCDELNVQFTDMSTESPTAWIWTFEGGTPENSNEQNPSVFYEAPGTYGVTLVVENEFGTNEVTLDAVVSVYEVPEFSLLVENESDSTANISVLYDAIPEDPSFEWSNGSTEQSITVNEAGTYVLTITDGNGCATTDSTTVSFDMTGLYDLSNHIAVYPNPTTERLIVELNDWNDNLEALLMDKTGRTVQVFALDSGTNYLDLSGDLASGTYFLSVVADGVFWSERVVVVR